MRRTSTRIGARTSTPAQRNAFTLLEALLAASILWMGVGLLWDGYVTHLKLQAKLDSEVDSLSELTTVCEQLSLDADAVTALPRQKAWADVTLPTAGGVVRWADSQAGLERHDPDGHTRLFARLHARELTIETIGPRMLVVAALRAAGDDADTVVARVIPIGAKR